MSNNKEVTDMNGAKVTIWVPIAMFICAYCTYQHMFNWYNGLLTKTITHFLLFCSGIVAGSFVGLLAAVTMFMILAGKDIAKNDDKKP